MRTLVIPILNRADNLLSQLQPLLKNYNKALEFDFLSNSDIEYKETDKVYNYLTLNRFNRFIYRIFVDRNIELKTNACVIRSMYNKLEHLKEKINQANRLIELIDNKVEATGVIYGKLDLPTYDKYAFFNYTIGMEKGFNTIINELRNLSKKADVWDKAFVVRVKGILHFEDSQEYDKLHQWLNLFNDCFYKHFQESMNAIFDMFKVAYSSDYDYARSRSLFLKDPLRLVYDRQDLRNFFNLQNDATDDDIKNSYKQFMTTTHKKPICPDGISKEIKDSHTAFDKSFEYVESRMVRCGLTQ